MLNKWSKVLYTSGVKAKPEKTFNTTEGLENTQKYKQGGISSPADKMEGIPQELNKVELSIKLIKTEEQVRGVLQGKAV